MKISGFSFACNAASLYYPVKESILSILPICDEFIMVVGKGKDGDETRDLVASIHDPKMKIIDTVWDLVPGTSDHVYRQQTNIGLSHCTGDWCFHLQCDEVIHEDDLPLIKALCEKHLDDPRIEGMAPRWLHFWGDYDHYFINHRWFYREVRIVRNRIGVESWGDSQYFRINGRRLRALEIAPRLFHYSYVRPPKVLRKKQIVARGIYRGRWNSYGKEEELQPWDYGSLEKMPRFRQTHPSVMRDWIKKMDWKDQLQYVGRSKTKFGHDRMKYRLLTFIEQNLLGGRRLGKSGYTPVRSAP